MFNPNDLLSQIGRMTVLSISGGRVAPVTNEDGTALVGIDLPVSNGYRVRVTLDEASDTYTVERLFVRSGKLSSKGIRTGVYADMVGETAYRASCFRSYDANEW